MIEQARHILKSVFGYEKFISLQQEVIENVLRGKDTLAVMPTGAGKSLCYQIPALVLGGVSIVVSPLIALMKDQVEQLAALDIPAASLNNSILPEVYRSNVERIRRVSTRLVYVAPETLLKPNVRALFESLPVACLAIDEAHCISEWGPDFRPEYRQLAEVRARMPGATCIALTATATPRVREDIKFNLGFDDSSEFIASFNRENLLIRVIRKEGSLRQVVDFLSRFSHESGIIYCATRKGVEDLCAALSSKGFSVCPYHAGLSDVERNRNQERFIRDEVRIIVATIAFGMGINKSNIRFVLHYDLPKNIESYYQEIGRAGRDGMTAECLLLLSYGDLYKIKSFFAKKEGVDRRVANLQLNAMMQFAEADGCRRAPLLDYFGESFPDDPCNMCDNCLAGEKELTDITIPAQKFLSCVKRTGECFGARHIIDVLLGAKARRILDRGHDRLSTYGIGKEYSRRQWQQLSRQLLHKKLLVQHPEFGGLSLTSRAWDVLRGKQSFLGRMDDSNRHPGLSDELLGNEAFQYDQQLFEALRHKRKEVADAANVPAYVVFSDRTLAEMAARFPRNQESMLQIHGIGQAKREKYGAIFISLIEEYCRDHSAQMVFPSPAMATSEISVAGLRRRHILTGEAFNAGQSVESLAKELRVKQGAVLDHLLRYFQEGYPLTYDGLLPLITVPETQRSKALGAFEQLGADLLRPVFDALNGEISYEDLKVLRLYFLSRHDPSILQARAASQEQQHNRKIVCLANSRKYSGCCVAGKELLSGRISRWIRPVGGSPTGELSPRETVMQNGSVPKLLDIISVQLGAGCPNTYRSENHRIAEGHWVWTGTLPLSRLPELCDEVESLWINGYHSRQGRNDRMPVELVHKNVTSSLLFIRPDNLSILVKEGVKGLKKIWAEFAHNGEVYRMTVTDPAVEVRYYKMDIGRYPLDGLQSHLTVSISEPYQDFCYKLVAGLISEPSDTPAGSRHE
jgi:ATP-dependent DNA helicase RecQ